MLLNLENLKLKYNLNIKGVIHIGAHVGQEMNTYKKINVPNVMFFEPIPSTFNKLKENVMGEAVLINSALGNFIGEIEMFTETINGGQSSSVLQPEYHLIQHPDIIFDGNEKVKMTMLDTFIEEKEKYNFINIDVQGYELEVFKGATETLKTVDYIMTEVNRDEVYVGCAKVNELDSFLNNYGFRRLETPWDGITWGDAFYAKISV